MSVLKVVTPQFMEIVMELSEHKKIFVDFCAEWCRPCKAIAPKIKKLAEEHQNVTFLKVDVDECPHLSEMYDVQSVPTFIFLERGNLAPIHQITGANFEEIQAFLGCSQHATA